MSILKNNTYYINLVLRLILLQVLFTIIKYFTIGFSESVVGSVSFAGGAPATFLPILGLLIIYTINNGYLKSIDIILLILMLLISILSFKRIIWFIYPFIVVSLNIIWGRLKYLKYILLLSPIIFYLGVRLNPSLNKEHKIWGSFDFTYATEFAEEYSGLKRSTIQNDESLGRFAGNNQMMQYVGREIYNFKTWFGYGPQTIYGISYEDYFAGNWKWRVTQKGSLTGAARFLIAYGLIGTILYLFLIIQLFYNVCKWRFSLFLIIFFLLEFFFYVDTLFVPFLIIPLLLLSNYVSLTNFDNLIYQFNVNKYLSSNFLRRLNN